jgi:hypothetical protein
MGARRLGDGSAADTLEADLLPRQGSRIRNDWSMKSSTFGGWVASLFLMILFYPISRATLHIPGTGPSSLSDLGHRFPGTLPRRWLAKPTEVKQLIALLVLTDFARRAVVWRN